jgi:hypothetical protein
MLLIFLNRSKILELIYSRVEPIFYQNLKNNLLEIIIFSIFGLFWFAIIKINLKNK